MEKVKCSLWAQTEANRFIIGLDLVTRSSDYTTDLYPTLKLCFLPQEATGENSSRVKLLFLTGIEDMPTYCLQQESHKQATTGWKAAQQQLTGVNYPSQGRQSPLVSFSEDWISRIKATKP